MEEPMAIARKALDAGAPEDAVAALDRLNMSGNVSGKGPVTAYLLRVEALIKAGRLDEARKAGEKAGFIDAWLDYLRARIADRRGNTDRALELYQSSLTKPSVTRSRAAVRNESLYQTALIYDRHYQSAPSPTTRLQAINAWNNLKRCYQTTPDHPRFRKANERLASIR